MTQLKPQPSL